MRESRQKDVRWRRDNLSRYGSSLSCCTVRGCGLEALIRSCVVLAVSKVMGRYSDGSSDHET